MCRCSKFKAIDYVTIINIEQITIVRFLQINQLRIFFDRYRVLIRRVPFSLAGIFTVARSIMRQKSQSYQCRAFIALAPNPGVSNLTPKPRQFNV